MEKRFLPFAMLLMAGALVAPSAKADITSRMTSSVQLTVNSAATQMNRIDLHLVSLVIMWIQLMVRLRIRLVLVL